MMRGLGFVTVLGMSGFALGADAPKATPELVAKGKAAFDANCAICHGEGGDLSKSPTGKAMNARNLSQDKMKAGDTSEKIFDTIAKGLPGTAMASFAHLPEGDRWGIAHYIVSLRKPSGSAAKPTK